jgi:hypothetical protein
MLPTLRNTLNELQFSVRERYLGQVALRRGLPSLPPLPPSLTAEQRYYTQVLRRAFGLGFPGSGSTETRQKEAVPPIQLLIDVGCRNWSYARALAEFFPHAELSGVDVDGARRYWNLYRRIDVANAHAAALANQGHVAKAECKDFQNLRELPSEKITLFTFFFPFVSENPCLGWGLPARFVNFQQLLRHSVRLADAAQTPGAHWISAHQGEWEAEEARLAYILAGLSCEETFLSTAEVRGLWPSPHETRIFRASRLPI